VGELTPGHSFTTPRWQRFNQSTQHWSDVQRKLTHRVINLSKVDLPETHEDEEKKLRKLG